MPALKYTDLIAPARLRDRMQEGRISLRERIGTITLDDDSEFALERAGAELIVCDQGTSIEVVVSLQTLADAMATLLAEHKNKQE